MAQALHLIAAKVYCLYMARDQRRNRSKSLWSVALDRLGLNDDEYDQFSGSTDFEWDEFGQQRSGPSTPLRPRSVAPVSSIFDQDAETSASESSSESRLGDRIHHATKSKIEVSVLSDRRDEKVRLPKKLKSSEAIQVELSYVPCTDRIENSDTGTWTFENHLVEILGFFSAKSRGLSEDSEPLLVAASTGQKQRLFMGVFDGMGGAGASVVERDENFTEAYRASRIARMECFDYSIEKVVNGILGLGRDEISGRDLTGLLQERMKARARDLGIGPGTSRLRGTLTKTLPTTLACADIAIERNAGSGNLSVRVRTLWAGDSRVWVLTPTRGLQQLTQDDVDIDDPLEQLRQDPPMTNVVSASVDFILNDVKRSFSGPCVIIAATDGVGGYVRSPGEVELHFLRCFYQSERTGVPVATLLKETFEGIAHDDISCVLSLVGFSGVSELNVAFETRRDELEARYESLNTELSTEEFSQAVDKIWANERSRYCELLRGGGA